MADAFHAIWGLWWYNFVKIEIQICYRSHLFHHHVALQKEGRRHFLTLKMGPWVTFRISFWIGFHGFFVVFGFAKKKFRSPRGRIFGMATDIEWLGVQKFFKRRQICGRQSWAVVWKVKKSNVFFLRPPPLFLTWIIKRKLGYFVFEQKIWTIEHFEIKLGLKQAGTANC